MAKKTTKKAAKKVAKKKTAKKAAAKKGKDPVAGSPAAKTDDRLTRAALKKIGEDMMSKKGRAPFSIPKSVADATRRAKELNNARDTEEVELSALLWTLQEKGAHADAAYSTMSEFCDKELEISPTKARTLVGNWNWFMQLGLHPAILSGPQGLSFSKFKLLKKALNAGHITHKNVAEWVPLVRKAGPGALTRTQLDSEVKTFLSKKAGKGEDPGDDPMQTFKFQLRRSEAEGFEESLDAFKDARGIESDGQAVFQALDLAASSNISDGGKAATAMGMVGLTNMMARVAPVVPIIHSLDDTFDFETLGVHPVQRIYASFKTKGGSEGWGAFILASSKESAAKVLGVKPDAIRAFEFAIAPELVPEAKYAAPKAQETEPDPEPAKTPDPESETEPEADPEAAPAGDGGKGFTFSEEDVDSTYLVCDYKGDEIDALVVGVNVDEEILQVKEADIEKDGWPVKGRKKAIKWSDVVRLHEEAEEEPEEEEEEEPEAEGDEFDLTDAAPKVPEFDVNDVKGMMAEVNRLGTMIKKKKAAEAKKINTKNAALTKEAKADHGDDADVKGIVLQKLVPYCYELAQANDLDPFVKESAAS